MTFMINHDLIEELAASLEVDRHEATRLLNAFAGAMVAELLAVRKLSVKGLGSFSVTHFPATKKKIGSNTIYTPPCNRLIFGSRISSADTTHSLAVSRLSMSTVDAARFARSLAAIFSAAVHRKSEIRFNGLGRFFLEGCTYSFVPERSLEELLNREYQDLEEVVLPQHEPLPGKKEWTKLRYVLPLSAVFLVGLLIAVLYGLYPHSLEFVSMPSQPQPVATAVIQKENAAGAGHPAPAVVAKAEALGGSQDSLVLAKDDYTIVLSTFRAEKTALRELVALRSGGIVAFVWPASLDGTKYYRLTTGKFSTRTAAKEYFKAMPRTTASGAYIQQVIKRVVLHGKKGL